MWGHCYRNTVCVSMCLTTQSPVSSMYFTPHNFEFKKHLLPGPCPLSFYLILSNFPGVSRDITLPAKVRLVNAMIFPVVMCGCKSWTIKIAEHWRIDGFELWCWRRLLRVPWTARRSNQSILKEINPEHSLEGLMLKLKLQYFGHLMGRADSLEKILMLGKIEGRRRREWQKMRCWKASPTQWTWIWVNSGSWWWTGRRGVLQSMGSQRIRHDWVTELNMLFLLWAALVRFSELPLCSFCNSAQSGHIHDYVPNTMAFKYVF